jgi:hypothetical protein
MELDAKGSRSEPGAPFRVLEFVPSAICAAQLVLLVSLEMELVPQTAVRFVVAGCQGTRSPTS